MTGHPRLIALLLAVLMWIGCAGCSAAWVLPGANAGATQPVPPGPPGSAAAALVVLPVKGRAPRTGFTRSAFGQSWRDIDRNGCDQRNDVLARDLDGPAFKPGTRNCLVLSGTLPDPYTGRPVGFVRGRLTSDDVQIDHVVALSHAWQTGAQQLDPATRERFANDPLNLIATAGPVNQAKGDSDAATWLPPLPLRVVPVRGPAGRRQGRLRPLGDRRRAQHHRRCAGRLPRPGSAAQHRRAARAADRARCPEMPEVGVVTHTAEESWLRATVSPSPAGLDSDRTRPPRSVPCPILSRPPSRPAPAAAPVAPSLPRSSPLAPASSAGLRPVG